jgi:predicted nucleic-acid-binding protein
MIGLDTNVLVRYLAQDDPRQSARATRLVERGLTDEIAGFIGLVVLVETALVLQRLYRASPEEIRQTVHDLLGSRCIVVESRDVVARALAVCASDGCGFADAVIAASAANAGCDRILTFDRGAVSAGMPLMKMSETAPVG